MNTQHKEGRFAFPGFELISQQDTSSHEVEVGKLTTKDGVFIVHLIRKADLPFAADFLPSKVYSRKGYLLWEFPRRSFNGIGRLAQAGDDVVIALLGRGSRGKVKDVVSFSFLKPAGQAPIDLYRKMELKVHAAAFLNREYELSTIEERLKKRRDAQANEEAARKQKEALQQKRAEEKARAEKRRQEREKRVARLLSRNPLEVWTVTEQRRSGVPVVGREWESLPHNTHVVIVDSYDENTGTVGEPYETFRVVKSPGKNPQKGARAAVSHLHEDVSTASPATHTESIKMPEPIGNVVIEQDGGAYEVAVYATMEDIRTAREAGLNNGALVAARDRQEEDGRVTVFSAKKERMDTVGVFTPIACV